MLQITSISPLLDTDKFYLSLSDHNTCHRRRTGLFLQSILIP